jgi:hypothetical protein
MAKKLCGKPLLGDANEFKVARLKSCVGYRSPRRQFRTLEIPQDVERATGTCITADYASPNERISRRERPDGSAASDFFAMARGLPRKTRAMAKKRSG